jgi:hypothetical protein
MVNPYIVPGVRVRYQVGGLVDHVVTFISEDGATLRLAGYDERRGRRVEDFKPVVRVKMGRMKWGWFRNHRICIAYEPNDFR